MKTTFYEVQVLNEFPSPPEWRKWSSFHGTEPNAIKQLKVFKNLSYLTNRKLRLVRVEYIEVLEAE